MPANFLISRMKTPLEIILPENLGKEKTKKSCHRQDPFQNINPNITLEIKSFLDLINNLDSILITL